MTPRGYLVVGIILLLLTLSGVSLYLYLSASSEIAVDTPPVSNISDARGSAAIPEMPFMTDDTTTETDTDRRLTIKTTIPKVVLPRNPVEETRTNDVLKGIVTREVEKFKQTIDEDGLNPNIPKEVGNDIAIGYETLFLSPAIITLRYDVSAYTAGAAHPDNYSIVLNYSIPDHIILDPRDLFDPGLDWMGFLASTTRGRLTMNCPDCGEDGFAMIKEGTEPTLDNFSRIGLATDKGDLNQNGIVIVFDPYQVAPYARGMQRVFIPLEEITPYLRLDIRNVLSGQKED